MGAFIGILLILLTIIYQSVSLDYDAVNNTRNKNATKTIEKNIIEEFSKLSTIEEDNKFNFINSNCKDNYSKILICQKRHTINTSTINNTGLNPSREFCNSFYNYVSYKKGILGRLTMNELKELLLEVNTINSNSQNFNKYILDRMYNETSDPDKQDFLTFEMTNFTTTPITSDENSTRYKDEFKKYNLKKYNKYFRASDLYEVDELYDRSEHPFSYKLSIKKSINIDKVLFEGKIVKFYTIIEDHDKEQVKKEGIKTFIKTYFNNILKYRELLLKIKRLSPEIDLFMEKNYNDDTTIIINEDKYSKIYEEFYLKYKGLLNILNIKDEELYVEVGEENIIDLKDNYKNNMAIFINQVIQLVDTIGDFNNFKFKGVVYDQPFSEKTSLINNKEEKEEIHNSNICDFSRYIKEVEY